MGSPTPSRPTWVAGYDFAPESRQPLGAVHSDAVFVHDEIVKKINGRYIGLLSYWGYIQVDLTRPSRSISGTICGRGLLLKRTGTGLSPEGNAHEAGFSRDNRYFVATDEDFDRNRVTATIQEGPFAGSTFTAVQASATPPIGEDPFLPARRTAPARLPRRRDRRTLGGRRAVFDRWGYIQLFDAKTFADLDQFAIPEAHDPAFAHDFGDLSVHEVTTDPGNDLTYSAYHSGGLRVPSHAGGRLREVGAFIAGPGMTTTSGQPVTQHGSNFWGIEVHKHPNSQKHVLASDRTRDSGSSSRRPAGRNGGRCVPG